MRKFLLVVLGLMVCFAAEAFGPGTHMWIAERVTESGQPCVLYGAAAPDVSHVASILGGGGELCQHFRWLTHHGFAILAGSPFAVGFATHNEVWGADAFAHGYRDADSGEWVEGWVIERARQLAGEAGIGEDAAHTYVEVALDFVLRRDYGAIAGNRVCFNALVGGLLGTERALADAFAFPLACGVDGVSEEDARRLICAAGKLYRLGLVLYGSQLAAGESHAMAIIPVGMALYAGTDVLSATMHFARAIQLCEGYEEDLDRFIPAIRDALAESQETAR